VTSGNSATASAYSTATACRPTARAIADAISTTASVGRITGAFSGSSGRRPAAQCQIEARAATAPSKSVERRHVDACRAEKNTIRIAAPIAKTATAATPITRESNPTTVTSLVRFRDDCGSRRPSVARKRDVVPAGAAVRSGSLTCRVTAFSTTARRSVMRTRRGLSRGIFVSEYRCLSTSDLTRAPRV
jgi:hypothetical protein